MTCKNKKCDAIIIENALYCHLCGRKQTASERTLKSKGNGQGTVFKRGKTWMAMVTKGYRLGKDGKYRPYRPTKGGFATKKEALEYLPILKGNKEKKKPTLYDYWETYENSKLPKLSKTRRDSYIIAKKKLDDIFHIPVDELTIKDLQDIVNKKSISYDTAKDMKTVLSHCYDYAVAQEDVKTNLSLYIELPETAESESRAFSKDEQNVLWKLYANNDPFVPYILLMIYTGMMPGELMIAEKSMVNIETQQIIGCGKKTKKRKETPIIIPDIAIPIINKIFEISKGNKLIHINKDNFYKEYYACLDRAKCDKIPPYSCRHTTGTALGTSDIPIVFTKELMRHSKLSSTEKYVHVDTSSMLEAANKARAKKEDKKI